MNTQNKTLRAAVIGTGYLGRFHAQKYAAMPDVELVAVVDSDPQRAQAVADECGTVGLTNMDPVALELDIASVVVPNTHHFGVTRPLLQAGVHVMLEKPLTNTVAEADELIDLALKGDLVLQAGHLERFNPAVKFMIEHANAPLFVEAHRLGGFKNRATDVDVVLDLMIHDIEILLKIVPGEVTEIRASGHRVLTSQLDIANARIEFSSGCVANLTASRVSLKDMRKIRVFQDGKYLSADCATRENVLVATDPGKPFTPDSMPQVLKHDPVDTLNEELLAFVKAVRGQAPVPVTGQEGRRALEVAIQVNEAIATADQRYGRKQTGQA